MNDRVTLLYDASCPICSLEMDHLRARDTGGRLAFVDISAPDFDAAAWNTTLDALNAELHAVRPDGSHVVGVPALRLAYDAVGLGAWWAPTRLPGLEPVFAHGYRLFAHHRRRLSTWAVPLIAAVRAHRTAAAMRGCHGGRCDLRGHEGGGR
jgi:predicted DCC family thiol-disulfide oxidoreductase YuxK